MFGVNPSPVEFGVDKEPRLPESAEVEERSPSAEHAGSSAAEMPAGTTDRKVRLGNDTSRISFR